MLSSMSYPLTKKQLLDQVGGNEFGVTGLAALQPSVEIMDVGKLTHAAVQANAIIEAAYWLPSRALNTRYH